LHHIELWVPNLDRAVATWGWLLGELGYELFQDWPGGQSWRSGPTYIVLEQSPARTASRHDRSRPGLNHLAFHVATAALTEALATAAVQHGWRLMFADRHPYAGGDGHYAAYLENVDGYEAELVALEVPAGLAAPPRPEARPASEDPPPGEPGPSPDRAQAKGPAAPAAEPVPARAAEPAPVPAAEPAQAAGPVPVPAAELAQAAEPVPVPAAEPVPAGVPAGAGTPEPAGVPAPGPAGGTSPEGEVPPASSA
jgi:catechol 2,3-dioxygenase-like lactoylglutathione lyase family enzyme